MQQIFPQKLNSFQILISLFFFSFHLRIGEQETELGPMEIWRCIWNRSREVPDPLTQSFFGEKILKRRKTRQSDRITFSSRSRLFFKFSFLFSSSLITPTWLIQQTLWYNVIKGDLQRLRESLIKKNGSSYRTVFESFALWLNLNFYSKESFIAP